MQHDVVNSKTTNCQRAAPMNGPNRHFYFHLIMLGSMLAINVFC